MSPLRRNERFLMNLGKKKYMYVYIFVFYYIVKIQRINLIMHAPSQCKKNIYIFADPNSLKTFYVGVKDSD